MADRAALGGASVRRSDMRLVMVSLCGGAAGVSGRRLRAIESGPHKPSRSGRNLRWRRFLLKNSQWAGDCIVSQRFACRLHSQLTDFIQMEFSQFA
jgi:hypothetical protein